jgi:hypothetical protein
LQLGIRKAAGPHGPSKSWESEKIRPTSFKIEIDGKTWTTLVDGSANEKPSFGSQAGQNTRFVITCTGNDQGGWASIREVRLKGPGIKAIAPKLSAEQKKAYDKANDPPPKKRQRRAEDRQTHAGEKRPF